MGLPICRETHRFIEPTTVDIRPYDIPEELLQVCGADRNEICPGGGNNRNRQCESGFCLGSTVFSFLDYLKCFAFSFT